ncbi:AAA family ATPase [Dactylosporangium sp. NPDC049140]|uniref:AAA family ATPase n=1 Tax=Dactylosporangium sp. NPDC049140 TaxID=3155647 RepID=UPI0033E7DFC1
MTRRRLVTIAARDYSDADDTFVRGIEGQVKILRDWLLDVKTLEKDAFEEDLHEALYPTTRRDVEDFLAEHALRDLLPADILVLYITGHGMRGESTTHYLLLPDTDRERLLATAIPTGRLVAEILDSNAEHVLVLIDTCHAGALDPELSGLTHDLERARRTLRSLVVIAACDFAERPRIGQFTGLLQQTLQRLRDVSGYTAPMLTLEEFLRELQLTAGEAKVPEPQVLWPRMSSGTTPSPCLPNPVPRRPAIVAAARSQLAPNEAELQYWLERAAGRVGRADPGWYAAPRAEIMRRIVGFLAGDARALIITGAAGTGKSALLARVVTFSDPRFLAEPRFAQLVADEPADLRPEPNAVQVAVSARNRGPEEIAEDIATRLPQSPGAAPSPLLDRLNQTAANGGTTVLVIDGVDEAAHPLRLVSELFTPLGQVTTPSGAPGVRLLIGVRSPGGIAEGIDATGPDYLLTALGPVLGRPEVLRVDRDDVVPDITEYVRALLAGDPGSPYADHPDDAEAAAATVAKAVAPSFLDARVAARRLREASAQQRLDDPDWLARLNEGTLGLLREDLADVAGETGRPVADLVAVLRATAFALGPGLPWAEVWPVAATAVRGRPWPDAGAVIADVLNSRLGGYLVTDVLDERMVYRPLHERVAEALRNAPESLEPGEGGP